MTRATESLVDTHQDADRSGLATRADSAVRLGDEPQDWLVESLFPRPPSRVLRCKLFVFGVLFPVVALTATATGLTWGAKWQSGKAEDFIPLLFSWPAIAPFLPFISFSLLCLAAVLIAPKSGRLAIVRLGVKSGALLAVACLGLHLFSDRLRGVALALVLAAIIGSLVSQTIEAAPGIKRLRKFTILHLSLLTAACAFGALAVKIGQVHESIPEIASLLFLVLLGATPLLAAIAHIRAAGILHRQPFALAPNRWSVALWFGWILAFATSVRWALILMLEEYSKLPTTAPTNCYVATAARHAFRNPPRVSLQTKRLKFLELCLKSAAPAAHRRLRVGYDRFGPRLAAWCALNRWFALATYIAFKPIELIAEAMRIGMRIAPASIAAMYPPDEHWAAIPPANALRSASSASPFEAVPSPGNPSASGRW